MGSKRNPLPGSILQLILRGRRAEALVDSADDWLALGVIAQRMLFWCGGSILGCRCEGNELRFAIQLAHAGVGAVAHHLSAAYGRRLRHERGWRGPVFKRYRVVPLEDELYLDDLVMWLHRPLDSSEGSSVSACYTAEAAYVSPPALPWINTLPVLSALSPSASPAAYRARKNEPVTTAFIESPASPGPESLPSMHKAQTPSIEFIASAVAQQLDLSVEELCSNSRRRPVARAKAVVVVLAARQGITVAAAARYLKRNRSTLIEGAERYRIQQPQLFEEAERALGLLLEVPDRDQAPRI